MIIKSIQEQIAETDVEAINSQLGDMPYAPYSYQYAVFDACANEVRAKNPPPFVVKASVSAGKTTMISMFCKRIVKLNEQGRAKHGAGFKDHEAWVVSRQGEIVEQDAVEMWNFNVPNSVFCAALNKKSTHYPIIVGSEKTLVNALEKRLADKAPRFLLVDECLTGDSLITTDAGQIRIDDPSIRERKIACINDLTGELFWHKPNRVWSNGIKHVSSLQLESGEVITCTGNHKLLSEGSWRRADSLIVGDSLTQCGLRDSFWIKLRRAVAAVARKLARQFR